MVDEYHLRQTDRDDIAIPTFSFRGIRNGWVIRKKNPSNPRHKVLTFCPEGALGAWYNTKPSYTRYKDFLHERLIIVEDCFSAMRANEYCHSMAMMGSWISPALAHLIERQPYEDIVLAMDPDAHDVGLKLIRKWRGILPHMRPVYWHEDFKDTTPQEADQMIKEL